jgi:cysteine desulfurase
VTRRYFDHASTSPTRPEVLEAMLPWFSAADPGRVHTEGRMARAALEDARDRVAAALGARSREVVFTSGATESINAATYGAGGHVVCAAVEHSAVLESAKRGPHTVTGVDSDGRIDVEQLLAAINDDTRLVHVQWGNHEVGTLQPVADVVAACADRQGVLVHVDAAQAVGHEAVDFQASGADLMSVSAHKLGGPKGIGALLVRRGLRVDPFVVGGEQERARRGGIENVAAAVGFATALEAAVDPDRERAQTERVLTAVEQVAGTRSYGDRHHRLPHIACVGVDGVEAEAVLLGLDQAGIAAHSGSACSSESLEPSPVLEAMGVEAERSLRISVGWSTTDDDVGALLDALPGVIDRLRQLGGQSPQ